VSAGEGAHKGDEIVIFGGRRRSGVAIVRCALAFFLSNHNRDSARTRDVGAWSAISALQ
jgi:hypothetical protein